MTLVKRTLRQQITKDRKKSAAKANVWLFYSMKLDKDVQMVGDLEMLYWVSELEIQPSVRSFKFDCEVEIVIEEGGKERLEKITATKVEYENGSIEFQVIDTKKEDSFEKVVVPIRYAIEGLNKNGLLVAISAAHLGKFSRSQLGFWLQIIAFVSQARGYDLRHEMGQVGMSISLYKEGTIAELLESVSIADRALAVSAICRTILQGSIVVDATASFGHNTHWRSS